MSKIKINLNGVIVEMEKEEVSKAIEAGELKIESDQIIPVNSENHVIYKKDDFETFKKNHGTEEYKKGKTAGEEMTVKFLREKTGIEFEGKNPDNFITAFKTKVLEEAKVEPSKKIKELEDDNNKLRANYTEIESQFTSFKTQISEKETRAKKDETLLSFLPEKGLKISKKLALIALKTEGGVDIDMGTDGSFVTENGQVVKDQKSLSPVKPDIFILEKLKAMDLLVKESGGGGGGDDTSGGGQTGSYEKFVKEMADKGIEEGSAKFSDEMNLRIKNKTLTI